MHSYAAALEAFAQAVELMPRPIERVEADSPDGILPGYLIPSGTDGSAPVVIFYNGFDVTKELLYGFIGDQFRTRRCTSSLPVRAVQRRRSRPRPAAHRRLVRPAPRRPARAVRLTDRPPRQGRRRRGRHAYDAMFGWSDDAARSMSS
jgi:hypothetical protein